MICVETSPGSATKSFIDHIRGQIDRIHPDELKELMAAIKPLLDINCALPITAKCTHPEASSADITAQARVDTKENSCALVGTFLDVGRRGNITCPPAYEDFAAKNNGLEEFVRKANMTMK